MRLVTKLLWILFNLTKISLIWVFDHHYYRLSTWLDRVAWKKDRERIPFAIIIQNVIKDSYVFSCCPGAGGRGLDPGRAYRVVHDARGAPSVRDAGGVAGDPDGGAGHPGREKSSEGVVDQDASENVKSIRYSLKASVEVSMWFFYLCYEHLGYGLKLQNPKV